MSLENRLRLQDLCNQIEELVKNEDLDFGYNHGGVYVHVASGRNYHEQDRFIEALKEYARAKRSAEGEQLAAVQKTLLAAVDACVKRIGV